MLSILRDIRFGLRGFGRSPGFTAVAVLTLALGLGANTAVFAVLYNVVLRPLPYPQSDRLVKIFLTLNADRRGVRDIGFSYPKFQDLERANTAFQSMSAYAQHRFITANPGPAERVYGEYATAAYFPMLGLTAAMGRTLTPEEDGSTGVHPVAILSDSFWRGRFGARPDVIGHILRADGQALEVIGVMPPGVRGDSGNAQFWVPFSMAEADSLTSRRQHWHQVIARLKPGVSVAQASGQVKAIMAQLEARQRTGNGVWDADVTLLGESKIDPSLSKGLIVLYAAVGFVLLIACANLANLTMARMVGRQREIAVRLSIGAGRAALVRQVLVENVLLSIAGGAAGMMLAAWSMRALALLRPESDAGAWPTYMRQLDARVMSVSGPVVAFGLALCVFTGVLFGLAPAWKACRGDVNGALKGSGWAAGHMGFRFQTVLLAGQMAMVVVLLTGAGMMLRSFARMTGVSIGAETKQILTVPLNLDYRRYPGPKARQFYDPVVARVQQLPGVHAAVISEGLPGLERGTVTTLEAIDSRPVSDHIGWRSVDPGFFEIFHIPILSGRSFLDRDRHGPAAAILSEEAARNLFPGQNPIGHHIRANRTICEIVGVAASVHYEKQRQQLAIAGDMYVTPAGRGYLIVRTAGDPLSLVPAVRKIVAGMDPEVPVQNARTMEENVYQVHSYERFNTFLLGVFAALALVLAIAGIYGVFSYAVAARTREFGIRLASGARPADVLRLVVSEAALLCGIGLAVGIPASLALSKVVSSAMQGMIGTDPWAFTGAAAVLALAALTASYLPARRASKLDPMIALRCD